MPYGYGAGQAFSTLGQRLLGLAGQMRADRLAAEEESQRAREQELALAAQGIRAGSRPNVTQPVRGAMPTPGDFAFPPLVPEPGPQELAGAAGMMTVPELGGMTPPMVTVPDPGYEQLIEPEGDMPGYYRRTPGYDERLAAEAARAEYDRDVPAAINAIRSGTGDFGAAAATLGRYDIDAGDFEVPPDEVPYFEQEAAFYSGLTPPPGYAYSAKGQLVRLPGAEERDLSAEQREFDSLVDIYTERYWNDDTGVSSRLTVDPNRLRAAARAIVRGEDPHLPPAPGQPTTFEDMLPGLLRRGGAGIRTIGPPGTTPPPTERDMADVGPARTTPKDTTPADTKTTDTKTTDTTTTHRHTDAEIAAVRSMLQDKTDSEKRRYLALNGFSEEDIQRVLGSG